MTTELRSAADFPASPTLGAAVERLVRAGSRAGLFFDFDGVLSRIQADPESVQPSEGVRPALQELATVVGRMALVSSRNAEFLLSRLPGVPNLQLYGLYGLEYVREDGTVDIAEEARRWMGAVQELYRDAVRDLPGVYVEDKKLSVGLHYRHAPQAGADIEEWAESAAGRFGFKVQHGRMVVELKPPVETDKGTVVTNLARDLDAAWFFGDDLGDLPAFAALRRRAAEDDRFDGLAVGVGNDTVVEEVRAQSDVFLASPLVLVDLLGYLRAQFAKA